MKLFSPSHSAASRISIADYIPAMNRTESLSFEPPTRDFFNKPCVDPDITLPVLLDYFDRHAPELLLGQTLAINRAPDPGASPDCPTPPGSRRLQCPQGINLRPAGQGTNCAVVVLSRALAQRELKMPQLVIQESLPDCLDAGIALLLLASGVIPDFGGFA
jgi:hypothetical protein